MKAKIIIKFALLLVFVTAMFYWRDVWAWVSAKTWDELTADIIGFVLKWFFLAIFGWLAVQVPHYIEPWLKLTRLNGRKSLKAARRGVEGRRLKVEGPQTPKVNKDALLMAFIEREMDQSRKGRRRDG